MAYNVWTGCGAACAERRSTSAVWQGEHELDGGELLWGQHALKGAGYVGNSGLMWARAVGL
jgi:hypothetical protein